MRVLLINFEMDKSSPVLAWQTRVAEELATHCTSIHVLTEKIGNYNSAPNITVDIIPRRPFGIPKAFGGGLFVNFQLYQLLKKHPCDVCFIHMAHKWTYRLWPTLKLNRLPILVWYAHGSISWHLKLATLCANKLVTSTDEGLRINTQKKIVIGQAIDTDLFRPSIIRTKKPEIVYVGRVSRRKRIELLIDTLKALRDIDPYKQWKLKIAGPVLTNDDQIYFLFLKNYIKSMSLEEYIEFMGPLTQTETVNLYQTASIHLNVSNTGSMDKTVMEALSCGCPVVTTNEAFIDVLKNIDSAYSTSSEPLRLAQNTYNISLSPPSIETLRKIIEGKNDLRTWSKKLRNVLCELIAEKRAD